jgi:lipooligosaccharide transport system permease protein
MFEIPKWTKTSGVFFFRHFSVFLHSIHLQVFEGLIQPFLYLLCFGLVLGEWFDITNVPSYLDYVYIGILCSIPMSVCCYELVYTLSSYANNKELKKYFSLLPMKQSEIYMASFAWAVFKAVLISFLFMLIAAVVGVQNPFLFLPAVLAILLVSTFFGALTLFLVAILGWDESNYNNIIILIIPFFLFSGTFFPVEVLPIGLQEFFYYSPTGYSIHLLRSKTLEAWSLLDYSLLSAYFALAVLLLGLSIPRLQVRLAPLRSK